jgi:hypothetical protein
LWRNGSARRRSGGAEQAAEQVRKAWAASGATQLISITPGCLGTLRRALPEVEVIDPVTLLAAHADALRFKPLSQRVALHLPCTQINVARSDVALTTLLRRIPGLEVMLLPSPPYCCGAAGSHLLEFPERAARLRDETLRQAARWNRNNCCRPISAAACICPPGSGRRPCCPTSADLAGPTIGIVPMNVRTLTPLDRLLANASARSRPSPARRQHRGHHPLPALPNRAWMRPSAATRPA